MSSAKSSMTATQKKQDSASKLTNHSNRVSAYKEQLSSSKVASKIMFDIKDVMAQRLFGAMATAASASHKRTAMFKNKDILFDANYTKNFVKSNVKL